MKEKDEVRKEGKKRENFLAALLKVTKDFFI